MLSTETIDVGDGIAVTAAPEVHALLGRAHAIRDASGQALTWMSVTDWTRPTELPTVAEPGRLPPGAGAAILNLIAERAAAAGVAALHYAGPYPTPALWRAAARSFRAQGGAEPAFCADVVGRAARVAREVMREIAFVPAPHRRVAWAAGGGWSEVRDGVERVVVGGIGYERTGSPARLVETERGAVAAELWFGDASYARVAVVDATGALVGAVQPVPPLSSRVLGQQFPRPLRDAIAELVADLVPPVLAEAAQARVAATPIRWADLGARAARSDAEGFALHAALWEHVGPHGLPRLALAIAEALAPAVTGALVSDLARVSVSP